MPQDYKQPEQSQNKSTADEIEARKKALENVKVSAVNNFMGILGLYNANTGKFRNGGVENKFPDEIFNDFINYFDKVEYEGKNQKDFEDEIIRSGKFPRLKTPEDVDRAFKAASILRGYSFLELEPDPFKSPRLGEDSALDAVRKKSIKEIGFSLDEGAKYRFDLTRLSVDTKKILTTAWQEVSPGRYEASVKLTPEQAEEIRSNNIKEAWIMVYPPDKGGGNYTLTAPKDRVDALKEAIQNFDEDKIKAISQGFASPDWLSTQPLSGGSSSIAFSSAPKGKDGPFLG